jgi:hypothetical protein
LQSNQVIDVVVRPSRVMAVMLIVVHGVAVWAVWVSGLPIATHITLKLALALSLCLSLRQSGWLNAPGFVTSLRIRPAAPEEGGDRVEAIFRNGSRLEGEVLEGNFVAPWLVTLGFRAHGSRRWLPPTVITLLPDSADRESLRRLRVRLRWGAAAPV